MKLVAMSNRKRYLALALLLGTLACDSHAQFGGGMGGMRHGSKSSDGQNAKADGNRASPMARQAQIADQLFDLRMRLLISPEQSGAWEIFYAKFLEFAATQPALASNFSEQTALQAMQGQLARAQSRFALTENLYEATKSLYTQLTPEQQRAADQWLPKLLPASGNAEGQKP